jgi:hypothetical protein
MVRGPPRGRCDAHAHGRLVLSFSEFAIIGGSAGYPRLPMWRVTNLVLLPAILAGARHQCPVVAFRWASPISSPVHGPGSLAVRLVVLLGTLRTFERGDHGQGE